MVLYCVSRQTIFLTFELRDAQVLLVMVVHLYIRTRFQVPVCNSSIRYLHRYTISPVHAQVTRIIIY